MLDDVEHLRDAVVDLADEPALGGNAVAAEGHLARRGDLQAHLVLDVGDEGAVTLAQFVGLEVEVRLRDEEQRQSLGAGACALGAGQDEVEDVLEQVVGVGGRDEPLDALDVPGAVVLLDGLGAACADVGTGIGFGEDHGGTPAALDAGGGPLLLLVGAVVEQHVRERGSGLVHVRGRLGAEDQLTDGPHDGPGDGDAADLFGESHAVPLGVPQCAERLLEGFRQGDGVILGVEDRRVAVGVGEGLAQRSLGEAGNFTEHVADGVGVEVAPHAVTQRLLETEYLEEVELQVADVALVMAHVFCLSQ